MQIVVGPVKQAAQSRCVDGGQSNGPPVIQACDFIFLRYGHNGGFFEACGNHRQREGQIENICKNPNTFCVCLLLFFGFCKTLFFRPILTID